MIYSNTLTFFNNKIHYGYNLILKNIKRFCFTLHKPIQPTYPQSKTSFTLHKLTSGFQTAIKRSGDTFVKMYPRIFFFIII